MLLTPHTLVGIAIGSSISNPFIAVPLAVAMHFVGDKVPHWDFYSNNKGEKRHVGWVPVAVMADMALGIGIALTATYYSLWALQDSNLALNIFLCGIASVLPDALEVPYIFFKSEPKILQPITLIQRKMQFQAPLPWGALTQIGIILASIAVILKYLPF